MYYAGFTDPPADALIRENFYKDYSYKGIIVEVGSGPPVHCSMSKHWRDHGWRAICVDPNPKFVNQHREDNSEIYQYACADFRGKSKFTIASTNIEPWIDGVSYSAIEIRYPNQPDYQYSNETTIDIDVITLNDLLSNLNVEKIDILSIDVEGWELDVMKGFDHKKYSPKIVVLENLLYDPSFNTYMENAGYKKFCDLYPNEIYLNFNQLINI